MATLKQQENKREKIKKAGQESLYFFAKHILGYNLLDKHVHKDICDILPKKRKLLIMFPRDCFKTTVYVIAYSIWLMIQPSSVKYKTGRNEKILISRKTYKETKKIIAEINQQLKTNVLLNDLYGSFNDGSKLLDERIVLVRGLKDKDATVTISGLDNSITGGHFTRIICDDLVNRLDRNSQAQRDNTLGYCQDLINMKDGEDTQYVYVGTRWHLRDLYYHFIETELLGKYRIINKPLINDDGVVLFPSRFSEKTIAELRKDSINWNSQYMLNPLSADVQIFKPDELLYFTGEIKGERFLYYDGAEGKKDSDYTSVIEGVQVLKDLYITRWWTEKWDAETSMNFIARLCIDDNYESVVLEANKESLLKKTLVDKIEKLNPMLAVAILEIKNTSNKDERIKNMQPIVKDHVYFKRAQDQDESYERGFDQLTFYPLVTHDDAPDSLEGLIRHSIKSVRLLGTDDRMKSKRRS